MENLTLWDLSRLFQAKSWKKLFYEGFGIMFLALPIVCISLLISERDNKQIFWALVGALLVTSFILLKYMCRAKAVFITKVGKIRIFKKGESYIMNTFSKDYTISQYNADLFRQPSEKFIFRYSDTINAWFESDEYGGETHYIGCKVTDTVYEKKYDYMKVSRDLKVHYGEKVNNIELNILQFDKFVQVTTTTYTTQLYVPLGKEDKIILDSSISQSIRVKAVFKPEYIQSYLLLQRKRAGMQVIAICKTPEGDWFYAYVIVPSFIYNQQSPLTTYIYVWEHTKYKQKYCKRNCNRALNGTIIELGKEQFGRWCEDCSIWQYNPESKKLEMEYRGEVSWIDFTNGTYGKN